MYAGQGKRDIQATFAFSFEQVVSRYPIPPSLQGPTNEAWRVLVADAAFQRSCATIDPSLERLLHPSAPLHWLSGAPVMPDTYAVVNEDPQTREPTLLEYLGSNHRRSTLGSFRDRFEALDRSGHLELRRTGHGPVVVDVARDIYAWVYVFPGGRRLRWPSVADGKFDGSTVVLTIEQPEPGAASIKVRGSWNRDA